MKTGTRFITLCLALLLGIGAVGCGAQKDAKPSEPTAEADVPAVDLGEYRLEKSDSEIYAYIVRTPHATWHLAAADIELIGEDAFFAGLSETLVHQEADFSDAIAALSGYLDEVPVIDIYTDFSGRTETAKLGAYGAYCRWNVPCIEVYSDFTMAKMALLHEYTHYLTHCCFAYAVDGNFWSEAIAEYVSRIVCKNRMACSIATEEDLKGLAAQGMLDADGGPSLEKVYRASSAMIRSGAMIGAMYSTVSQAPMQMTEQLLAHPMLTTLSYHEAGCFFDWLVDHYGKDLVFTHMTIGQEGFREVFGEDFETLFFQWAADNDAWCAENGIVLGPMEE
jgi:hypothetical protein